MSNTTDISNGIAQLNWVRDTAVQIAVGIAAGNPNMIATSIADEAKKTAICLGKNLGILEFDWKCPNERTDWNYPVKSKKP